ncbi:translation initiation factor IF-2-like [Meles meles]|uniref:translation initiation factor IF-2-like n=1 Tax=Meles meles TaxID=9662 RepID=UPI001E69DE43|nr:translation initiation factor IF-2-like [Meles meles]
MAAVDSSIKKKRKFFFFSFQSLNGEGEGAGHAEPSALGRKGPKARPECVGRRGCPGGGAAALVGRPAPGAAATFVLLAAGRRGTGLRPGGEPGPQAWSRRRLGPPVPLGDSAGSWLLTALPVRDSPAVIRPGRLPSPDASDAPGLLQVTDRPRACADGETEAGSGRGRDSTSPPLSEVRGSQDPWAAVPQREATGLPDATPSAAREGAGAASGLGSLTSGLRAWTPRERPRPEVPLAPRGGSRQHSPALRPEVLVGKASPAARFPQPEPCESAQAPPSRSTQPPHVLYLFLRVPPPRSPASPGWLRWQLPTCVPWRSTLQPTQHPR